MNRVSLLSKGYLGRMVLGVSRPTGISSFNAQVSFVSPVRHPTGINSMFLFEEPDARPPVYGEHIARLAKRHVDPDHNVGGA